MSKEGRNIKKCQEYLQSGRRMKNVARRLLSKMRKWKRYEELINTIKIGRKRETPRLLKEFKGA